MALDSNARLVFLDGLPEVRPSIRHLKDYAPVLAPGSTLEGPDEAYLMYRGVGWPADREMLKRYDYRYDITVLKAGTVGRELVKTVGHYHPPVPGARTTYPEVYEVISGLAHYVCQKVDGKKLLDFLVVEAQAGEKVVIPPEYGHITINAGDDPLVMSNVTADGFDSIYEPFEALGGAAYYELAGRSWIRNPSYNHSSVTAKRMRPLPRLPEAGLREDTPLYRTITAQPEAFDFLVRPQEHPEAFARTFDFAADLEAGEGT